MPRYMLPCLGSRGRDVLRGIVASYRDGVPRDSDGDDYDDIEEMLVEADPNDPNDCPGKPTASPKPTLTATTTTPSPKPTVTPSPTLPLSLTPTLAPTQTPSPEEDGSGVGFPIFAFEAVFTIAGLLAVAYLVLRRKR